MGIFDISGKMILPVEYNDVLYDPRDRGVILAR